MAYAEVNKIELAQQRGWRKSEGAWGEYTTIRRLMAELTIFYGRTGSQHEQNLNSHRTGGEA